MFSAPRILVVDDNPAIHDDFRKILGRMPVRHESLESAEEILFDAPRRDSLAVCFEVKSAMQGQEALELLHLALAEGRPFALAFVDVRMPPGWDGIETIERLWEADPSLQIVVCTAYSDYSWEKMSARLGVNDNLVILKKPFDNIEVLQLAHALSRKWALNLQVRDRVESLDQAVTQRTVALEAASGELLSSQERFTVAFRAIPIALGIRQQEFGAFVDANDALAALTGYSRDELTALDDGATADLIHYTDPVVGADSLRDAPAQIKTRDGGMRDVLVSLEQILITGRPHQLVMIQDVSQQLQLESQLRQAQKMEAIGQLAAGIAHDFNNLLTIIQGHASMHLATAGQDEDLTESLTEIEQAAERAADLTRQLLTFSRRQMMRPRVLDLNALITDLIAMLRRVLGEKVELRCELADPLPPVWADPTSVEQVIMNLTVNARDAMPRGGVIRIFTRVVDLLEPAAAAAAGASPIEPGSYVCVGVSDDGVGITKAVQARMFEPFFTTKGVNQGTGMGLATVYGITHQHHGWIDVESVPGEGATFSVHFPATTREADIDAEPDDSPPELTHECTVFVVEDDELVRKLVEGILRHHGYDVVTASGGDQALKIWPSIRDEVQLLLTDMVMPGEYNGLGLARKLLADRPDLKVIYSSGYSADLFESDVELEEGRNYLPKPYLRSTLIGILARALDTVAVPAA